MNQLKQFVFSRIETGYESIHSFIRENFESQDNPSPSFVSGDLIVVQSKIGPKKTKSILVREVVELKEPVFEVKISSHLAFDNRHRGNVIPIRLGIEEAVKKFTELSGLEPLKDSDVGFLGCHREKKFNIHNSFGFRGWFKVLDIEKLKKCLTQGVGSRKSYGYGLIIIEDQKE